MSARPPVEAPRITTWPGLRSNARALRTSNPRLSDGESTEGELTASILEDHLTSLEKKIDDLMAGFDDAEVRKFEALGRGEKKEEEKGEGDEVNEGKPSI